MAAGDAATAAAADASDNAGVPSEKGSTKCITMEELSKHCTETDCWITINGKVYDVTKFMDDHPGGGDVMLNSTGRDATDDFEDIGHSSDARKMLLDYYIGELDPKDVPKRAAAAADQRAVPTTTKKSASETSAFMIFLQILVPVAIIGLAIAVRFITAPSRPEVSS